MESEKSSTTYINFVDPFIGTSAAGNPTIGTTNGGNTFPGAVRPFGMVSVSPHNDSVAPSGYYSGKKYLYGFGHVHLSGVGCQDLGNIVLLPTQGKIKPSFKDARTTYTKEEASPGYYKSELLDFNVKAEMSATTRSGISKYTFLNKSDSANILINLVQGVMPKSPTEPPFEGEVKIVSPTEVEGFNYSGDFCSGKSFHPVYFVAVFSKPSVKSGVWKNNTVIQKPNEKGKNLGAWLTFQTEKNESILVKVGISYVSVANARSNLKAEQDGFNFENIKKEAAQDWENHLSRIRVEGGSEKEKRIFYSGLYHMLLHPNVFSDANGDYIAMKSYPAHKDNGVRNAKGYTRYSVYSLWDTYRNVHPFFALVYPERQSDMVKSLLGMYEESGRLPKWELASGETNTMVGDPAIPVIADSWIKGIKDFDKELAFRAMYTNATSKDTLKIRPGLSSYLKYKYIPEDDKGEWLWGSVSTTLEYNFSDWCFAQFCHSTGKDSVYNAMIDRSGYYKNLFDPGKLMFRSKKKDGTWLEPFDPLTLKGGDLDFPGAGGPGFVEGNAWHYNFFVPHDIPGLKQLMNGEANFASHLDKCFAEGHYVLWNEPDMANPFLYDYLSPNYLWKTQKEVRFQMEKNFNDSPEGIPGNDDCGTISTFYVFGAMGFYPCCPASDEYQMCSPLFEKVTIDLNPKYFAGKQFIIQTINNSPADMFIRKAMLNEKEIIPSTLKHKDIISGGKLVLTMSSTPVKK